LKKHLLSIMNLSAVSGLTILGFSIIAPVLPQYALSFSVPVELTGWAISAFAVARLVLNLPGGMLADRYGRKPLMILGLVLIIVSSLMTGAATSFNWLVFGRVVQGAGSALYITAATTWVAQISSGVYRGRILSLYSGLIFAATSLGPTIGGFSAAHFGLSAPFFVYGGCAFLGLLATIPLKEARVTESEQTSRTRLADIPKIFLNLPFLLVNTSVFAVFFLRGGVRSTLFPLYAHLNLAMSEEQIGLLLTATAVTSSVMSFPSGWLSDRIGRKKPMIACMLLSSAAILLMPGQHNAGGLLVVMLFYGFASGLQGSVAAWPADVAPKELLGTAMGAYRVIGDAGMVIGPIAATYLVGAGGGETVRFLPFLMPAALLVFVGIILIWARDPAAAMRATSGGTEGFDAT